MPRKPKEDDQIIDLNQKPKKETFVTRWFNDYAVDDKDKLKIICDMTARSAKDQFNMVLRSGNTEVYAVIFYVTFMEIINFIRKKQKMYNEFTIQIANSINMGYCNNDNDDNEKTGNFFPILEYINVNRNIVNNDSITPDSTSENFLKWKELNVKKNAESFKEIQENAYNTLIQEYHVSLRTSEAVIPLFCIFLDNVTSYLKFLYKEAEGTVSEVSLNVLGLYSAYYSYDEENDKEIIEFTPSIAVKLALKQDDVAARE